MSILVSQILLAVAILTTGVVYGTDVFHAIVVKKAAALSSDQSLADMMGHTHLVADKRMPLVGVSGIISTLLLSVLNYNTSLVMYSGAAFLALILHLFIYLKVAKPINQQMSAGVVAKQMPSGIRLLQLRWDSVIAYRAILLAVAMVSLIIGAFMVGACDLVK
ncbi:hypothetical protein AAFN85_08765 [Mucilaginibacter sp. CAU 1740]|uniref:hypothetical protein n=1 Tax=Mucilaginibacter sp. CAU 1740 TaxID=3140365 RepID=UPI00325A85BB